MSVRPLGPWLAVAALAGALFPLQAAIDRHRGPPPDVLVTLPPRRIARALAFGHQPLAVDLLEARAATFFMEGLRRTDRLDREQLERMYDTVVAIDPWDAWAHLRASVLLFALTDRPEAAARFLTRGIETVPPGAPGRVRLFVELAGIHLSAANLEPDDAVRAARLRRAGQALLDGAEDPGAPPDLARVGERLLRRGLSRLDGLRHEVEAWEGRTQVGEPELRARARARLAEARADLRREELQALVDALVARRGAPPGALAELGPEVDLSDPLGEGFRLEGGRVVAPGVERARARRALGAALEARLEAYEAERGRPPARVEELLEGLEVPAGVTVVLEGGRPVVRADQ